jgi:hypothetical protein
MVLQKGAMPKFIPSSFNDEIQNGRLNMKNLTLLLIAFIVLNLSVIASPTAKPPDLHDSVSHVPAQIFPNDSPAPVEDLILARNQELCESFIKTKSSPAKIPGIQAKPPKLIRAREQPNVVKLE